MKSRTALVRRLVARLRREYRPSRVILFGSYATGRATAESDIDVLIVKDTAQSFYRRLADVRRIVSPILKGHPFDPIVMTPRELRTRLAKGDQFLKAILASGKSMDGGRN